MMKLLVAAWVVLSILFGVLGFYIGQNFDEWLWRYNFERAREAYIEKARQERKVVQGE